MHRFKTADFNSGTGALTHGKEDVAKPKKTRVIAAPKKIYVSQEMYCWYVISLEFLIVMIYFEYMCVLEQ